MTSKRAMNATLLQLVNPDHAIISKAPGNRSRFEKRKRFDRHDTIKSPKKSHKIWGSVSDRSAGERASEAHSALFDSMRTKLDEMGFALFALFPGYVHELTGQTLQVDGFFVRDTLQAAR